jgi:hypothetical protein
MSRDQNDNERVIVKFPESCKWKLACIETDKLFPDRVRSGVGELEFIYGEVMPLRIFQYCNELWFVNDGGLKAIGDYQIN